jgi:hypothetical protein
VNAIFVVISSELFQLSSAAALLENDLANRRLPMLSLITTLGGTIAAVCSRCQSQLNYEFAMDRFKKVVGDLGFVDYWRARGWPAQCRSAGANDFACD